MTHITLLIQTVTLTQSNLSTDGMQAKKHTYKCEIQPHPYFIIVGCYYLRFSRCIIFALPLKLELWFIFFFLYHRTTQHQLTTGNIMCISRTFCQTTTFFLQYVACGSATEWQSDMRGCGFNSHPVH